MGLDLLLFVAFIFILEYWVALVIEDRKPCQRLRALCAVLDWNKQRRHSQQQLQLRCSTRSRIVWLRRPMAYCRFEHVLTEAETI